MIPCLKTSSFQGVTTFTEFDESALGAIIPCLKTTVEELLLTSEVFHENDVTPFYKTTVDRGPHAVRATVIDLDADFAVTVGTHTYRLVGGELVEEGLGPS